MVFGYLTDSIENAIDVLGSISEGGPTKYQVSRLIDDGLSIAAIAAMWGVSEDVIKSLVEK